ncbi:MAG: HIRAN domain-containing protein [Collinsella sp.]
MLNESFELTSWWHHDCVPLEYGDELGIVPEPENEYDPDAIALYKGVEKVGYVPAHRTKAIHHARESGAILTATVEVDGDEELGISPVVLIQDSEARAPEQKETVSLGLPLGVALAVGLALLIGGLVICVASLWHLFDGTFFPRLLVGWLMILAAYLVFKYN